jgi:hypothetical protein
VSVKYDEVNEGVLRAGEGVRKSAEPYASERMFEKKNDGNAPDGDAAAQGCIRSGLLRESGEVSYDRRGADPERPDYASRQERRG